MRKFTTMVSSVLVDVLSACHVGLCFVSSRLDFAQHGMRLVSEVVKTHSLLTTLCFAIKYVSYIQLTVVVLYLAVTIKKFWVRCALYFRQH